jgi:Zn-dependent protease
LTAAVALAILVRVFRMNWNWSLRAFRLLGTEVRIHWTLLAFSLYYVLRAARLEPSPLFLGLFVVLPFVLLFASVTLHEFGHVLAARHYGLHVGQTILTPVGGMVMVGQSRTPRSELVVAAAGPLVNVALVVLGLTAYLGLGGLASFGMVVPLGGDDSWLATGGRLELLVLRDFVETNAMLFWFNVLTVAYPLDGGRILFAVLWQRRGYEQGMLLAGKVSRVLAVLLGIAAIVTFSPLLGVIAVLVWVQASMALRQLATAEQYGLRLSPGPMPASSRSRTARSAPRRWSLGGWLERRRTARYLELVVKASAKGLDALSRSEREFMRRERERRLN